MSTTRILINSEDGELHIAVVENGKLKDLNIERPGLEQKKANIYKGVISSIEPSLEAVFVNYGSERHGFLPFKEVSPEYYLQPTKDDGQKPKIQELVKLGQEVVVQVEKEERGNKGAALTTYISLAGSYLVLMPNSPKAGGISRRVDGSDREQLKIILGELERPEGIGVIARTAAIGKNKKELEWDLSVLLGYWQAVKKAAVAKAGPYLIHQESDAIVRTVRDYLREDVNELLIDDQKLYDRAYQYINQVKPSFLPRLHLYSGSLPLFNFYRIEQQIETAFHREVRLPSGGSIVIDRTEALVAIDINSAKATRGKGIEETALTINVEAAVEIARQLRLRDLGGLVVIDFIDMLDSQHQKKVEESLRQALSDDRARIQLGRISRFGLLEMSRQRLRSPLNMANQIACPRCQGQGHIRNVESLALSIIRIIQEQACVDKHIHFQLQAPIDVATYLTNEKRHVLEELELTYSARIAVIPNKHLETPNYHLKRIKDEHLGTDLEKKITSYRLIRQAKPQDHEIPQRIHKAVEEPLIKDFLPKDINKAPRGGTGLIKQIWDKVFGLATSEEETSEKKEQKNQPVKRSQSNTRRRNQYNNRRSGANQNKSTPNGPGGKNPRQGGAKTNKSQPARVNQSQPSGAAPSQQQKDNRQPSPRQNRPTGNVPKPQQQGNPPSSANAPKPVNQPPRQNRPTGNVPKPQQQGNPPSSANAPKPVNQPPRQNRPTGNVPKPQQQGNPPSSANAPKPVNQPPRQNRPTGNVPKPQQQGNPPSSANAPKPVNQPSRQDRPTGNVPKPQQQGNPPSSANAPKPVNQPPRQNRPTGNVPKPQQQGNPPSSANAPKPVNQPPRQDRPTGNVPKPQQQGNPPSSANAPKPVNQPPRQNRPTGNVPKPQQQGNPPSSANAPKPVNQPPRQNRPTGNVPKPTDQQTRHSHSKVEESKEQQEKSNTDKGKE